MSEFIPVTNVAECRPTVQAAAIALEQHIRDKASKGQVRPAYDLYRWFKERVQPGVEDLRIALLSDPQDPAVYLAEVEHRAINLFTRAYYVGLLAEMWGPGE